MDAQVLVVGAGPTGLMLANQLSRHGVQPLVIDRHDGPVRETRALGVQARTLEIYRGLGVVDRALELGKPASGANLWARGKRMARVRFADADGRTPYPYILVLGQDDNERILGDRLRELHSTVQWRTELVALEQSHDAASVTLRQPDGTSRKLNVAWVAGCDGARSRVREQCGIAFEGAPYEHVFFVADVQATGTMTPGEVNVYLWRSGFHLFFPMRGDDHWRIVGIVPESLQHRPGLGFDAVWPSLRSEAGRALDVRACSWFSTYRIHHRMAARFRDRRAFLLGDAAHIHSPVGAQGMNTGLQDAYNLGWKLALVATGRASEALLDSYADERMPVARRLLQTTDRAFRVVVSDAPLAGLLRTEVLARIAATVMATAPIRRAVFRIVSQIGIGYRGSALSRSLQRLPASAPQAGDRFPWLRLRWRSEGAVEDSFDVLDDRRMNLVVFGQAQPTPDRSPELAVHRPPEDDANSRELARVGVPKPSAFLVRPDGYIGLAGTRIDTADVSRYLADRLRLRTA